MFFVMQRAPLVNTFFKTESDVFTFINKKIFQALQIFLCHKLKRAKLYKLKFISKLEQKKHK